MAIVKMEPDGGNDGEEEYLDIGLKKELNFSADMLRVLDHVVPSTAPATSQGSEAPRKELFEEPATQYSMTFYPLACHIIGKCDSHDFNISATEDMCRSQWAIPESYKSLPPWQESYDDGMKYGGIRSVLDDLALLLTRDKDTSLGIETRHGKESNANDELRLYVAYRRSDKAESENMVEYLSFLIRNLIRFRSERLRGYIGAPVLTAMRIRCLDFTLPCILQSQLRLTGFMAGLTLFLGLSPQSVGKALVSEGTFLPSEGWLEIFKQVERAWNEARYAMNSDVCHFDVAEIALPLRPDHPAYQICLNGLQLVAMTAEVLIDLQKSLIDLCGSPASYVNGRLHREDLRYKQLRRIGMSLEAICNLNSKGFFGFVYDIIFRLRSAEVMAWNPPHELNPGGVKLPSVSEDPCRYGLYLEPQALLLHRIDNLCTQMTRVTLLAFEPGNYFEQLFGGGKFKVEVIPNGSDIHGREGIFRSAHHSQSIPKKFNKDVSGSVGTVIGSMIHDLHFVGPLQDPNDDLGRLTAVAIERHQFISTIEDLLLTAEDQALTEMGVHNELILASYFNKRKKMTPPDENCGYIIGTNRPPCMVCDTIFRTDPAFEHFVISRGSSSKWFGATQIPENLKRSTFKKVMDITAEVLRGNLEFKLSGKEYLDLVRRGHRAASSMDVGADMDQMSGRGNNRQGAPNHGKRTKTPGTQTSRMGTLGRVFRENTLPRSFLRVINHTHLIDRISNQQLPGPQITSNIRISEFRYGTNSQPGIRTISGPRLFGTFSGIPSQMQMPGGIRKVSGSVRTRILYKRPPLLAECRL